MELNVKQENVIRDFLNEADDNTIMNIVREINNYNGDLEQLVWYEMEEFDWLMDGISAWDIARATFYGDFNPTHKYWKWDAYSNFESAEWLNYDSNDYEAIIEALENIPWIDFPVDIKDLLEEIDREEDEE